MSATSSMYTSQRSDLCVCCLPPTSAITLALCTPSATGVFAVMVTEGEQPAPCSTMHRETLAVKAVW